MRDSGALVLLIALVFSSAMRAQNIPGLVPVQNAVPATQARKVCVHLSQEAESEIQGPHGDSLIAISCAVASLGSADSAAPPRWITAHYNWTSIYRAEDSTRGPGARDTVVEEEAVLFRTTSSGGLVPVWHGRIETGNYAIWRSITPEVAPARGGTLLSIMKCVNGTGGCNQEFLLRHPDGSWVPLGQVWLHQLPPGFEGHIRHGVRIDPRTLRGEAGFYGDQDPNCCPSQNLIVHLTVRGDSLVLLRQAVRPATP